MNVEYLMIEAGQLGCEVWPGFLEDEFRNVEKHSVGVGSGSLHVYGALLGRNDKYNIGLLI